jgi:GTP-binding protein SAR1
MSLSFLLDWFWATVYRWGLWKKEAVMLLLGLDNAGKSTLLSKLKTGKLGRFVPTQRPVAEDVDVGNVRIKCFDLGGHAAARDVWRDYCAQAQVIVFMVDTADRVRLEEASESLWNVAEGEDQKRSTLLVVIGNKIDRPDPVSADELHTVLKLTEVSKFFRTTALFQVSLYTGAGFQETFKWIEDNL